MILIRGLSGISMLLVQRFDAIFNGFVLRKKKAGPETEWGLKKTDGEKGTGRAVVWPGRGNVPGEKNKLEKRPGRALTFVRVMFWRGCLHWNLQCLPDAQGIFLLSGSRKNTGRSGSFLPGETDRKRQIYTVSESILRPGNSSFIIAENIFGGQGSSRRPGKDTAVRRKETPILGHGRTGSAPNLFTADIW